MINQDFSRKIILHEVERFDMKDLKPSGPRDRQRLLQDIRDPRKSYLHKVNPREIPKLVKDISNFDATRLNSSGPPSCKQTLLKDIRKNHFRFLASLDDINKIHNEIRNLKNVNPLRNSGKKTKEDEFKKRVLLLKNIQRFILDLNPTKTRCRATLNQNIRSKEYELKPAQPKSRASLLTSIRAYPKSRQTLKPRTKLLKEIREANDPFQRSVRTLPNYKFVNFELCMYQIDGVLFRYLPMNGTKDVSSMLQDIRSKNFRKELKRVQPARNRTKLHSEIRSYEKEKKLIKRKELLEEIRHFDHECLRERNTLRRSDNLLVRAMVFDELTMVAGLGIFKGKRGVQTKNREEMLTLIRDPKSRLSLKKSQVGGVKMLLKELVEQSKVWANRWETRDNTSLKRRIGKTRDRQGLKKEIRSNRDFGEGVLKKTKNRMVCRSDLFKEIRKAAVQRRNAKFWKIETLNELIHGDRKFLMGISTRVRDPLNRVLLFKELESLKL